MNELELIELIKNDENVELECKKSADEVPNDLWKTYSAFANTNGGIILLGIEQKGYEFFIKGVNEPSKILRDFWNLVNNKSKVNLNVLKDEDVEIIEVDNKKVVKIFVPRVDRRQKPIYIGSNPLIGTYRRRFDGDYKCLEFEVKRMLADQSDISQDERVLKNYTMEDINIESLERYRKRFNAFKPTHTWIDLDNTEFLTRIGGWGKDRENNVYGLTLAGLIMFGNEWVITREISDYFLDYREKMDSTIITKWDDRITSQDATWSGNVFDFFYKTINRLTEDINIPFKLKDFAREEDTPVHQAIREALANTLIHADYYGSRGIVIERHKDYFKFSNPGGLRISVMQAIKGGISDPRNKNLFKMFLMIGIGERAGSGVENIYKVWNEQSFRKPEIVESNEPDRTMLILRTVSLLPDKSLKFLRNIIGKKFDAFSRTEIIALVSAHQEEQITNTRLQILTSKNSIEVNKVLSLLVEKELLVSDGQGRGTKYFLSNKFINKIDIIEDNKPSKEVEESSISTDDINKIIMEISLPAREKKRLDKEIMEKIIFELCKVKPVTVDELSELLKRDIGGIRKIYLSSMVKEGKLLLLYPGQINHPKQAYFANNE